MAASRSGAAVPLSLASHVPTPASPCGYDGGNSDGCPKDNPGDGGCALGGYEHRLNDRTLIENARPTILRDRCHQQTPLQFVGAIQWLQWGDDEPNHATIPTTHTSSFDYPIGRQWTPGTGLWRLVGRSMSENGPPQLSAPRTCKGSQFKPPLPGAFGFCGQTPNEKIDIPRGRRALTTGPLWIDQVQIPQDLPPGDYVLGFHIDAEQTPQVWQYCSDSSRI